MSSVKTFLLTIGLLPIYGHAALNFYAADYTVLSPSTIEVVNDQGETLKLVIQGPRYTEVDSQPCSTDRRVKMKCERLHEVLTGQKLGVIIERKSDGQVYGDITTNQAVLSETMIFQGWYRVDISKARNHALLLAEKEAYCHYRGIWSVNRGIPEVAAKCQEM
tara:strand:+ start:454 stop:942 length:489 start_codon:yes stop_codon:yes gene_type:complete